MHALAKQELRDLICSEKNRSGYYTRESTWKKAFPEFFNELLTWAFPDEFTFQQRIYHFLNDDKELLLGICPVCGRRCQFQNTVKGYCRFCSMRCINISDETREKIKETCLERYGVENYNNRKKSKETCLERYGVENPSQSEEIKGKKKETCLDHYGAESYSQTDEYREKFKETCLERYGEEHPLQNKEIHEKQKQTCLKKYGVEYSLQSDEVRAKSKESCLEKYGVDRYSKTNEYRQKYKDVEWVKVINERSYQTKKKNNSFSTSKIEDQLKEYFDLNGVNYISQYKSDLYPFSCDFYFPDKDLYVEIQGSWTHGTHPFTGSEEDMETVEKWRSKGTKYYDNAVMVWSVRDVKKREVAKKNKLNWVEIFSCDLDECINELMTLDI